VARRFRSTSDASTVSDASLSAPPAQKFPNHLTGQWQRYRFLVLAMTIGLLLVIALAGWQRDFRVPLSFSNDALVFEMLAKGTLDHGWWWVNPSISAPYEFHSLAFPSNSNVDHLIVWLVSRFTNGIGYCVNFSWMLMLMLAGVCMQFCAESFGLSRWTSWILGLLYAFAPYSLYREIDHFSLAIYLVPLPATAALMALTNRVPLTSLRWVLVCGCALIGFNYVYYAFFAAYFLVVAAACGYLNHRTKSILSFAGICLSALLLSTILNTTPSLYVLAHEGQPRIVRTKVPAESEVYGLKIRQLVSPVFESSIKPFRTWTQKEAEAQFPLETENMIDRLGFVVSLGFLGVLAAAIVGWRGRSEEGALAAASGRLTICAVLLATIGGFGSLFALMISPEIRAYNRITAFLIFFSLIGVGAALDRLARFVRDRHFWPQAGLIAGAVVAMFGIYDQAQALGALNRVHQKTAGGFNQVDSYVRQLEARLPAGSMVYQLPFRTYLNDSGIARMGPYDHARLYLVSRQLRWSYPALSNQQVDFQDDLMKLPSSALLQRLKARGFRALLIDRFGYPDNGAEIMRDCEKSLGSGAKLANDDRYVAYDLSALARGALEVTSMQPEAVNSRAAFQVPQCQGAPLYNVDGIGNATAPLAGKTPQARLEGQLTLNGWTIDQDAKQPAGGVELVVDGAKTFPATYGIPRPDVAAYFKLPSYELSGFSASISSKDLGPGLHHLALRVLSPSHSCYRQGPDLTFEIR
jgi:phosphoglycerol transferase